MSVRPVSTGLLMCSLLVPDLTGATGLLPSLFFRGRLLVGLLRLLRRLLQVLDVRLDVLNLRLDAGLLLATHIRQLALPLLFILRQLLLKTKKRPPHKSKTHARGEHT